MVSCLHYDLEMVLTSHWSRASVTGGSAPKLLLTLFKALATDEYALTDYEVSIVMPYYLVLHVGHKISLLPMVSGRSWPRLISFTLRILPSAQSSLRDFCSMALIQISFAIALPDSSIWRRLEEFIIFHGIKTVGMKGLKLVAKHGIASTESATRSAALRTACTGWKAWCDLKIFHLCFSCETFCRAPHS